MEEMYYYWLHSISGIGRITFQKILNHMTPEELYKSNLYKGIEFLNEKQKETIAESKKRWDIRKEWEELEKRKIHLLIRGKENYPPKLAQIWDAPPVLYCKGKQEILKKPAVAVIGARACSNYGTLAAKEMGKVLADMGIVVISGMAKGVDGICQWTSLENHGESVGVLGCGVEVCYPAQNQKLYQRLQTEGCLVSENPPFMQPSPGLFPLRNRIISGLADVVAVIEAREKSGTLITVDMALEQGKEVYAMPGRINDSVSRGCNKLIKQGAGVILSMREFVEEICPLLQVQYQNTKQPQPTLVLTTQEHVIIESIGVDLKNLEEIYQSTKIKYPEMTLSKVMELLLELQMKSIVKEENGYYALKEWGVEGSFL